MLIALEARLPVKDTVPQGPVATAWIPKHTRGIFTYLIFETCIHCSSVECRHYTHTKASCINAF